MSDLFASSLLAGASHEAAAVEKDIFSLVRARQVLALLDRDPASLQDGDLLPQGWHSAMFSPAVGPSALRPDGFAGIGVTLPPTDLPRLMFGGRRITFNGDIRIGGPATRLCRLVSATAKTGRSGRLMVVTVQRDIHVGAAGPVVSEQQDYILREAHSGQAEEAGPPGHPSAGGRVFFADAQMLFRYCALTFNTHRIHYDHPYATGVEGYPALVVNGNLTALMLTELFREQAAREPVQVMTRNVRPLFCDRSNSLHARPGAESWRVWAEDEAGRTALEADIR